MACTHRYAPTARERESERERGMKRIRTRTAHGFLSYRQQNRQTSSVRTKLKETTKEQYPNEEKESD